MYHKLLVLISYFFGFKCTHTELKSTHVIKFVEHSKNWRALIHNYTVLIIIQHS